MTTYRPEPDHFFEKVDKQDDGCWIWTASRTTAGYGSFTRGRTRRHIGAHRWSYEYHKGPIPDGMVVDHTCFTRSCVNPDHLRLATSKQNNENRSGPQANNTSGFRGVWYCKQTGRYGVQIKVDGKNKFLGRYATAEEAGEVARLGRLGVYTHNLRDRQPA